jgi:uncharacterized damage-inducible protein DinB
MSLKAVYVTLFDFHWATTHRLFDASADLEESAYRNNSGPGERSIYDLLLHLLATDYAWRVALETGKRPKPLSSRDYPELASLRAGFEHEADDWDALLVGLEDAAFEAGATLESRGRQMDIPRWRVMQHVILHGMQHHAELAARLTGLGRSPGDLDFIFFAGKR